MGRSGKAEYAMGAISLLSNRLSRFCEGQLGDVTFRQWFLLTMVSRMGAGEKNVRSVAEFVGSTRQNVRKMTVPLERGGYLRTARSTRDARSLDVSLTPKATRYLADHDPLVAAETERLFSGLSDDELDTFVLLLRKAMACVDEYDADR